MAEDRRDLDDQGVRLCATRERQQFQHAAAYCAPLREKENREDQGRDADQHRVDRAEENPPDRRQREREHHADAIADFGLHLSERGQRDPIAEPVAQERFDVGDAVLRSDHVVARMPDQDDDLRVADRDDHQRQENEAAGEGHVHDRDRRAARHPALQALHERRHAERDESRHEKDRDRARNTDRDECGRC